MQKVWKARLINLIRKSKIIEKSIMLVLGGWGWGWCWVGWVLLLSFVQCSRPGCVVSLPLTLWQHGLHAQDSPSLSLSLLSLSTSVFISRAPYNSGPPSCLPFPSLPLFVSVFLFPFSHSLALFQPSPSSSLSLYRLLLVNIFPFPSPLFYFFFLNIHKPFNLDFPLNLSRSRVYLMLFFFPVIVVFPSK